MLEEKKQAVYEKLILELDSVKKQVDQARALISEEKYSEAFEITKRLSAMADRRPIVEDDGKSAYYNFSEEHEIFIPKVRYFSMLLFSCS